MPNTYAESLDLTCPQCSKSFTAETFVIVDVAEQPKLLEKIRSGTLHEIPCPHCDHQRQVDLPLLIFRQDDDPHVLFSPAQGTSQEEDQKEASKLVERLKDSLGSTWQDDWLKDGIEGVQRQFLPAALSDDPEIVMKELAEQQTQELDALKTENPEKYLQTMLNAWLGAQDLAQERQILEDTPELLSDQAASLLQTMLEMAQDSKNELAEQFIRGHLDLLAACRTDGLTAVFEQLESQQDRPEGLQEILQELNRLTRRSDMPRRIELCQQALKMAPRETQLELWGALQNSLANSLAQTPTGDRAENIEQAIGHFQQALEVRIRQAFPKDWATTQNDLAVTYKNRIRGDRAENIEQAIHHYQRALEAITRQAFPDDWASINNNLGNVYDLRIHGERAENIELAIQHYQQALETRTHQVNPEPWANTQYSLGNICFERIRGDRAENIEQAINHYKQALNVSTRKADPGRWANIQNRIGIAFRNRIRGERAENIEQAIQYYGQALKVRNLQAFPEDWADLRNNLGNVYAERILGDRADNIEQAIQHYDQALKVRTRQAFPEDWASIHDNLGNAYAARINGGHAENIELAIQHYEQALEVRTQKAFPEAWAMTLNNLAPTYRERIKGGRAENIEQSILLFQKALEVHTRKTFPVGWAIIQYNIANAYGERIHGDRAENLEEAIFHSHESLKVRTRQAHPEHWAMTQNSLATIYSVRVSGNQAENIELSIYHCHQALKIYTLRAFPLEWSMAQNNLAKAYAARIQGEKAKNLSKSNFHARQALKVHTRKSFPYIWAILQRNLGLNHSIQALISTVCKRTKHLKRAILQFQIALEVLTPQTFPTECRKTALVLGNLVFEEQRWELARDSYETALAAQDVLMQASFTRSGKQFELVEVQYLSRRAAYAYFQLGEFERAVEVLEQGRAQLLREALERQREDLQQLPALGFKKLYDDYMQATEQYNELQRFLSSNENRPEYWISQIDKALEKVQSASTAVREEAGQSLPQYRYFLQALPFAEIQKQAMEKPLVYLCATSAGGLALIVTAQGVKTIELPDLNQASLQALLWQLSDEERERIQDHLEQGLMTLEDIQTAIGSYLSLYMMPVLENASDELKLNLREAWFDTIDETTRWLWDAIMGELVAELKEFGEDVTLIPTGRLVLLPLHAAWTEDKTKPTGRLYALDELCFNYAPSAHALWQASLAAERPAETLMAVDNPDGSLFFTEDEVHAVMDGFEKSKTKHLYGDEATFDAVKKEMQEAHVLHFSTHGIAGWQEAEEARLKMADGDLTLADIFKFDLDQSRLAVLSACETGVPNIKLIDEMIGLPAGMMQAGVPGVIGSLWSVSDMSTAMLMAQFYSLWREDGLHPQEALRQAQIWLRDSTTTQKKELFDHFMDRKTVNVKMSTDSAQAFYEHIWRTEPDARIFESPFYWAAFTYTGI
jgi:CHAT domain-containing protein